MSSMRLIDTIHAAVIRAARRFFVSTRLMNSPIRYWLAGLNRSLARWRLSGRHTEASQVHGHVFFLPPGDHVGAMMYRSGNFEPETTILWQNLAAPGMTVVDLGAYVGYFTLLACRQLGERGRVYAFEPQSLAREVLEKNIAANGYQSLVTVVPKAVSSAADTATLFLAEHNMAVASLFHQTREHSAKTVEVQCISLDGYFETEGWPSVDLIKMDIEGAEKAALEGMSELSCRNPQLKLIVEFTPVTLQAADVSPDELFGMLKKSGFISISVIYKELRPVRSPEEVVGLMRRFGRSPVNLLCEKL